MFFRGSKGGEWVGSEEWYVPWGGLRRGTESSSKKKKEFSSFKEVHINEIVPANELLNFFTGKSITIIS